MPALRDRADDVPFLVEHFISKFKQRYDGRAIAIQPEVLSVLGEYAWPGNVRELENVVESLMALAANDTVEVADLPRKIREPGDGSPEVVVPQAGGSTFEEAERRFEMEMIVKALRRADFVQTKAAELLGISRRILKYKMDKLGIDEKGNVVVRAAQDVAEK
jgi:DNA-binding NtrC family response regulator